MRLHKLEMNEFLAFKGKVVIDFDNIAQDSIFLLFGETGAGKTSILDAISYALYGQTSRVSKQKGLDHLRCQYSEEAHPTSVTLELSISGQRYSVTRTLAQRREVGHDVRASCVLKIAQGEGWVIPEDLTRVNLVGEYLEEKIGLNADQFFQVVMLPQGKFQLFLESTTPKREEILKSLFRADRFSEIEIWFKDEAGQLKKRANDSLEELRITAGQIDPTADLEHLEVGHLNLDWLLEQERNAKTEEASKQSIVDTLKQQVELGEAKVSIQEDNKTNYGEYLALQENLSGATSALNEFKEFLALEGIPLESLDSNSVVNVVEKLSEWQTRIVNLQQQLSDSSRAIELKNEIFALEKTIVSLRLELQGFVAEVSRIEKIRDEAATAARHLAKEIDARNQAQELVDVLERVQKTQKEIGSVHDRLDKAKKTQAKAKAKYEDLITKREHSIAAELAESLEDGIACAVCGSIEHPKPATRIQDHVEKTDVDDAKEKSDKANADVSGLEAKLENLKSDLKSFQARLGARADVQKDDAEAELESLRVRVEELESRIALANTVEESTAPQEKLAREEAIQSNELELGLKRQELDGLSVPENIQMLEPELDLLTSKVTRSAEEQWVNTLSSLIATRDSAKTSLDAKKPIKYSKEEHDAAIDSLDIATKQLQAAQTDLATASSKVLGIQQKSDQYKAKLQAFEAVHSKYLLVYEMSKTIAGNATIKEVKKVSLQSYYLSTRFDQVLEYANVRLAKMSGNKFVLVRGEGGRGQSYLDIEIYDAWTARKRPTYGISGGETFMVSLSLALGLADAVINSAGVAPFESLFIDEGFGSLGPVTLDAVMESLFDLQAGDRAIGVISHVAAMAERIPRQIHVNKAQGGSSVSIHYAGGS